jgi:hypothetical protein
MIDEAKDEAQWLAKNAGQKTIRLTENYDVIGSLGHQAVEIAASDCGVPFNSFRKQKLSGGDKVDAQYENDLIDVKSHGGTFNESYFHNQSFLVMSHQLEKLEKDITHLCFVLVDLEDNKAYIYGVISFQDFLDEATPKKLRYDNLEIKGYQLRPFRKYIFRT